MVAKEVTMTPIGKWPVRRKVGVPRAREAAAATLLSERRETSGALVESRIDPVARFHHDSIVNNHAIFVRGGAIVRSLGVDALTQGPA